MAKTYKIVAITILYLIVGILSGYMLIRWLIGYPVGMNIIIVFFMTFISLFLGIKNLMTLINNKKKFKS